MGTNGPPNHGIPDTKSKIDKKCGNGLGGTLGKKCPGTLDLDALFPPCANHPVTLAQCLDEKIECEVCLALNALDGLDRDCDEFDNGIADGSCGAPPVQKDADNDGHIITIELCLGSDPNDPNSTPESFSSPPTCTDGVDNDLDTLIDRDDPGCAPATTAVKTFPDAGLDVFESSLTLEGYELATPLGICPVDFDDTGPTCVQRGAPVDLGGGQREIDTEIVAMQLTGTATILADPNCQLPAGPVPVTIIESLAKASTGKVTDTNSDPSWDFPADSFFDVFFEVEIPSVGTIPGGPPGGPAGESVHVEIAGVNILPPYNIQPSSPGNPCLNPNHPAPHCYAVLGLPHLHCATPPRYLDHFKVYDVDDVATPIPVQLVDQFLDAPDVDLEVLDKFANPVQKTVGLTDERVFEIYDPMAHLTWYRFTGSAPSRLVVIQNQLVPEWALVVTNPTHLLVPTRKEELCPPMKLDHFKCYDVFQDPGLDVQVRLQDQFDHPNEQVVTVREAVKFCNPVDKNGEGIENPEDHLTCYRIEPNVSQDLPVNIGNQLDPNQDITVRENEYLCVPTLKLFWEPASCEEGHPPECGGDCPPGEMCIDVGGFCQCVPAEPCEFTLPPVCGGDCPLPLNCTDTGLNCQCLP
jgi:hypothetical protein